MDSYHLSQYSQAKNALEAKELKSKLMVADWPNYKDGDRRSIIQNLNKQADPFKSQVKARPLTEDEIKGIIGGLNG